MEAYTDLYELLVYLAGPIGAAGWMMVLSNAIRNMRNGDLANMPPVDGKVAEWVRSLSPLSLHALVIVLSLGVPALAALALAFVPVETLARLQPTFAFIAMLLVVYMAQQVWFQITKPPRFLG